MVQRICSPALSGYRRALLAFSLVALTVLPLAVRAQDVIVLPPQTATPANVPVLPVTAPVPAPVAAAPRSAPPSVPRMLPLATTTAQPVVATAALDPHNSGSARPTPIASWPPMAAARWRRSARLGSR